MEKSDQRLMFWVEGKMVSKFVFNIIPQPGQLWTIPLGDHNLDRPAEWKTVKVLTVQISPSSSRVDVDIEAEYSQSN